MKKRHLKIFEPVYRSCADILVDYTFDEMKKWIEESQHESEPKLDDFHRFSEGVAFQIKGKTGRLHQVIWLARWKHDTDAIGNLIHELTHLTFRILEVKQIPIRGDNDEIFCYLLEYYVKEVLKKI